MENMQEELNRLFFLYYEQSRIYHRRCLWHWESHCFGAGKNKYDIVINYLTSKQAAADLKKKIIETYGVRCLTVCGDVSDVEQVDQMINEVETQFRRSRYPDQ